MLRRLVRKKNEKVFCISIQKTGTTSVGKFFRDFEYKWAGWPASIKNDWMKLWFDGDYESIFNSLDFKKHNAYEDSPWFYPGFYKILYHRFPDAKFILFTRDQDEWFRSMMSHSGGSILGRTRIHSKVYRRELEFFDLYSAGLINEESEMPDYKERVMKLLDQKKNYMQLYKLHTLEVIDFFERTSPDSLFVCGLADEKKWQKLGVFLGINVPENYECHENSSV